MVSYSGVEFRPDVLALQERARRKGASWTMHLIFWPIAVVCVAGPAAWLWRQVIG